MHGDPIRRRESRCAANDYDPAVLKRASRTRARADELLHAAFRRLGIARGHSPIVHHEVLVQIPARSVGELDTQGRASSLSKGPEGRQNLRVSSATPGRRTRVEACWGTGRTLHADDRSVAHARSQNVGFVPHPFGFATVAVPLVVVATNKSRRPWC